MIFAVFDVNIIISALITPGGLAKSLLVAWQNGRFDLLLSPEILGTLVRKMTRSRLTESYYITDRELLNFLGIVLVQARFVVPPVAARLVVTGDPEDDGVLAAAVLGRAEYLVTGDRRLQRLREHQGVKIVNPRTFLDVLSGTPSE